jgi:DNA repair photolyase
MAPEQLFELRRRTFDTPHFRGIEFIETEAKTILNKVPGNYLPFNWTINAYRGCSHACSFCIEGSTPVLMGDGRTKPIRDLAVGDEIYGTVFDGKYRRYVRTDVQAHWQTVKDAYRVVLEDGTELIASGDHRFLSERGWKHVIGAEQGPLQRPFLTTNNKLIGTGHYAKPPRQDIQYRTGYLTGMIRGDAHLRTAPYTSSAGNRISPSFRLALCDREALERTRRYLSDLGIATREFVFAEAVGSRRHVDAIRGGVEAASRIGALIRWPNDRTLQWCRGFLSGIFDAEGSCSQGVFRISNKDPEIIEAITSSLRRLNFYYVVEDHKKNGVLYVRLLGGLRERLRFFLATDPAIMRKRDLSGVALKSDARLGVVAIEPLGIETPMYDITTGTGDFIANGVVSHNCFARPTHTYLDMNAASDFERKIVVKVNAPELLRKELRAKRWKGESVAMGTNTDPYQRAEGRYRLTRRLIEALAEVRNPFSILTKGTLILRDLDVIADAARFSDVSTAFSIPTLDEDVWRRSEPGTPHPRKRIEAVARLNQAGVACGVLVAPLLPGISDSKEQIRTVVEAALDAGATFVSPILLHLRPIVKDVYLDWLGDNYPDLMPRYEEMYARSAYARPSDKKELTRRFDDVLAITGRPRPRPRRRRPPPSSLRREARR